MWCCRRLLRIPWSARRSNQSILKEINPEYPFEGLVLKLLLSHFSRVWPCATPLTSTHQAPPSLGFCRQEYWSGLPFPSPMHESEKWKCSRSVMSNSLRPHGLQPTRFLCPWDSPGKNTGVGCHRLLRVLKLELQYFAYLLQKTNSLEKTLMLGKTEDKRRRGKQRIRRLDTITNSTDMNLSKLQETVKDRKAWLAAVYAVTKSQTQWSNWATLHYVNILH